MNLPKRWLYSISLEPSRLVGYYGARAGHRKCHKMFPGNLKIDSSTHLNLAHPSIDPTTLQLVTIDSQTPASVFQQTPEIRYQSSGNTGVEVFVSIGGPDAEPINGTAVWSVFSAIASNRARREHFARNVLHFMIEYGYDGVDLDWEVSSCTQPLVALQPHAQGELNIAVAQY